MEAKPTTMKKKRKLFWISLLYAVLLIIIIGGLSIVLWDLQYTPKIMFVPVYILEWGFVGGMLAVLYQAAYRRKDKNAEIELETWIVAKPIIGIFMGGLVYFLATLGEIVLNNRTEIQNIYFLNILAFIGGFSDRFSIDLIERVASRSIGTKSEKDKD
jgi:peptidoglycan/LPS O-acetylase OafA/YrhL